MLYDRPYMRDSSNPRDSAVLTWTIGALIATFAIQWIAILITKNQAAPFINSYIAVTPQGLSHGYGWTLLTYGFLHSDILHILFNILGLYVFGRAVMPMMGLTRFIAFFFGSMVLGGLAWFGVAMAAGLSGYLLGVSAVCFGLIAVFATLFPEQPIGFLFLPVTMKPKHLAWAMAGVSLFCMVVFEIPGRDSIAHSAHLGGMLAGWIYGRYIHHRTGELVFLRPAIELPTWMRKRKRAATALPPTFIVHVAPPQDLKVEVDRILDKINSQGFGSLTEEERHILDEARDVLNRR